MLQVGAVVVCPEEWILLGRQCYKFHPDTPNNYATAEAQCAQEESHLAVVDTQEEIALLRAFLDTEYGVSSLQFWIGLKKATAIEGKVRVHSQAPIIVLLTSQLPPWCFNAHSKPSNSLARIDHSAAC